MRIGMVTDSLSHLALDDLLHTAAELGIAAIGPLRLLHRKWA